MKGKILKRQVTPVESIFSLSPFSVVALVFRVKGNIKKSELKRAVDSMRKRHYLLNSVIEKSEDGKSIFTPASGKPIDLEIVPRESDKQWTEVYHNHCIVPFQFDKKPCIRFTLLQAEDVCELMIFSHHIICDGLSLAYLGRDILEYIGSPVEGEPEMLNPVPVGKDNMPGELRMSGFVESILTKMNKKFQGDREYFDLNDYRNLHKSYWDAFSHEMHHHLLSEEETWSVIESCKKNNVSVNSAIAAAVCGARQKSQSNSISGKKHTIAVSIRNSLPENPAQGMGFYAGSIEVPFVYNGKVGLWKNAAKYHKKVTSRLNTKNIFKNILNWSYLDPGIMESLNFKILGSLTGKHGNSKLYSYSRKEDLVASLVRREKMNSMDNIIMDTAITNLGNLEIDKYYGDLELDSVIMNPGGAFPLAMVQLVVALVTVSGKMSILFEYEKSRFSEEQVRAVMEEALRLLKA